MYRISMFTKQLAAKKPHINHAYQHSIVLMKHDLFGNEAKRGVPGKNASATEEKITRKQSLEVWSNARK